jgi:hypothetical protein
MATEQTLIRELVHAKHINAKREKEAVNIAHEPALWEHWHGQEIAFKQLLDILTQN